MQRTSTVVAKRRVAAGVILAALIAASITPAQANSNNSGQSLVGTWNVQVTLRNCDTGAPLGPPFNSLVSFHQGGTVSEAAASLVFAPGQRTPGHGSWTRKPGHTFGQSMVALILFSTPPNLPGTPGFDPNLPVSPGFQAGWQTVSHTITPVDADHITSEGTNAFYTLSGDVYRTGCSTASGQRFE
jgi:hypothetical protein